MIKKIELKNFKCFNQASLDTNMLTILAGANAAGKSSVIQAVLLADYTARLSRTSIDVNQVFGFPIGAPNALVSQNPVDEDSYAFQIILQEESGPSVYQYAIDMASPLELCVQKSSRSLGRAFQYLNAERIGPRVSVQAGNGDGITFDGENAAYLMEAADRMERKVAEQLKVGQQQSEKFSYFVENWMSAVLGDLRLDIHTDYNKAITELRIQNHLVDKGVVPTLTGFGISYVLPVIVAGLWGSTEKNAGLLLENPEAHLHPYAQSNMGKFLAILAACGVQVIVETHSEHIIDGARYQAAYMGITDQMTVNFMENVEDHIRIQKILVSERGELSSWPPGFFDQKQKDLRDILMLRKTHAQS